MVPSIDEDEVDVAGSPSPGRSADAPPADERGPGRGPDFGAFALGATLPGRGAPSAEGSRHGGPRVPWPEVAPEWSPHLDASPDDEDVPGPTADPQTTALLVVGPGYVFAGRYRIRHKIARGGMSTIWEARDERIDRLVALKLMSPHLADEPDYLARFEQEAKAAARLASPHVVGLYDYGIHEGLPFMVLERLSGEDLFRRTKRVGAIGVAETVRVIEQTAAALHAAHRAGIVHRDVKPHNLFLADVDGDEVVKLLDFGVAKHAGTAALRTRTGLMVGSPYFMSPEQVRGARDVDARSDLFSLGAVAYLCLTGRTPFQGAMPAVFLAILEGRPPPATSLRPELPAAVDTFFARALALDPRDRFATAPELAAALRRAVEGAPVGASPRAPDASPRAPEVSPRAPEVSPGPRNVSPRAPDVSPGPPEGSPGPSNTSPSPPNTARFAPSASAPFRPAREDRAPGPARSRPRVVVADDDAPRPSEFPTAISPIPDEILRGSAATVAPGPLGPALSSLLPLVPPSSTPVPVHRELPPVLFERTVILDDAALGPAARRGDAMSGPASARGGVRATSDSGDGPAFSEGAPGFSIAMRSYQPSVWAAPPRVRTAPRERLRLAIPLVLASMAGFVVAVAVLVVVWALFG